MYKKLLFVYPAIFIFCKRFTSTKELNILLKQVSINVCKTLDWVVCLGDFPFSCHLGLFSQGCLNSSDPPQNSLRSAHKAVKSTLVSKQNTAALIFFFFLNSVIIPWELRPNLWHTHTHTPRLGAHFYAWLNTYFRHPGVCFFKNLRWSETFGKLQLTSAIVWTHYEFPLVFHAANTLRQCCGVAATVLSDSAASLSCYVASTATPKKIKINCTEAQEQVSKMGQPHCPQFFMT